MALGLKLICQLQLQGFPNIILSLSTDTSTFSGDFGGGAAGAAMDRTFAGQSVPLQVFNVEQAIKSGRYEDAKALCAALRQQHPGRGWRSKLHPSVAVYLLPAQTSVTSQLFPAQMSLCARRMSSTNQNWAQLHRTTHNIRNNTAW